jgi:type I restriction enzyme, S subunit
LRNDHRWNRRSTCKPLRPNRRSSISFFKCSRRSSRYVESCLHFAQANDTILSKSKLRVGDVLVVRTGYPGTSCVVTEQFNGANCIELVILRPRKTMLAEFLSRFFNSESGRQQALNAKTGLAQQHLNVGAVKRTKVPFPSLDEQREITDILQTVDRKIDIPTSRRSVRCKIFSKRCCANS